MYERGIRVQIFSGRGSHFVDINNPMLMETEVETHSLSAYLGKN